MIRRCALVVASLTLVACAPTPVEVVLEFPSNDTFLFSDFGRLLVYPVDLADPAQDCPALLDAVTAGNFGDPLYDTDFQNVCDFRNGGLGFAEVPAGPHAYVVLTRDNGNNLLLSGCRVAEAFEGAPLVEVRLFPTATYDAMTEGRALTCSSEEDKCRSGC